MAIRFRRCNTVISNHSRFSIHFEILEIFNAEVLIREDCTADELIDVISKNRVYLNCLYVYNKIDQVSMEELDRLARRPHSVVISCNMRLNLDEFHEKMWEYLNLIRVYTKKPGNTPDFSDGLILRKGKVIIIILLNSNILTSTHLSLQLGSSIEHVCHTIHRSIADVFKYALIWVSSRNNLRRKKNNFPFYFLNH